MLCFLSSLRLRVLWPAFAGLLFYFGAFLKTFEMAHLPEWIAHEAGREAMGLALSALCCGALIFMERKLAGRA